MPPLISVLSSILRQLLQNPRKHWNNKEHRYEWVDLCKPSLNSFMMENTIIQKPVHCIIKTCVMRHITIIVMFLSHLVATLQKIRSFFERTKQKSVKKNLAIPNRYLLVQSQQWKHQKSVWNMFKVNNKETRTTYMKPSGTFIVSFEHISHSFLCFHSWVWTSKCRFEWIIFSMKCLDRNLGRNSAKRRC